MEIVDDLDPTDDRRIEPIQLFSGYPIFGVGFAACQSGLISLQEVASHFEAGDMP